MNTAKLIWGLEELSDYPLQEKLWTGKIEGEMSSFVEAVSIIYDDSGLGYLLDSHKLDNKILSPFEEKAIQLEELVKCIPQSSEPLEIIRHPLMVHVRKLATEMLQLIR